MFVLKLIGKILLLLVWVILAIAFGMYQNALIFAGAIAVTFMILVLGAAVDVLLETARKSIMQVIFS